MWKGAADSKKTKRLSQEAIKKQLLELIVINEFIESEDLNRQAEEVEDLKEAAKVIQKYENIIKTKKEGIVSIHIIKARFLKSLRTRRSLTH